MIGSGPIHFGPGGRILFGWLHRPSAPSTVGVVLCNPFGYEAVCTHRTLRHLAQAAAGAGVTALRFDHDGTGDSAGDDHDPARLAAWIRSVHHAIDELRRVGGIERVILLGVRLGALVAGLAAVERDDIDGLIAIAPVVAGKPYLRELRALQMSMGLSDPPAGTAAPTHAQEAAGFAITAETKDALSRADLTALPKRPAPSVLLIERDDLPASDAWPTQLTSLGVSLERRRLPGYVEMMQGADSSVVPAAIVAATTDWLRRLVGGPSVTPRPTVALPCAEGEGEGRGAFAASGARARFGEVVESAEWVGDERRLFGVLANPAGPPPTRRRGLLLLNAGSIHRIGPNRLYVALARRWAALGHAVLRLDISGIGDSAPRPGEPENVVYTDHASADIMAGIALLRRQPGVAEVHAVGLCSGGYNAFKAAVSGIALDGVLLINPLTFFFKPGVALEAAPHEVIGETARYSSRLRSLEGWKKLLRGEVQITTAAQVVARRAAGLARDRALALVRLAGVRVGDDLPFELQTIARRRVALRFLFAGGDPGLSLLRDQGGRTVDQLRRRGALQLEIIEGPNHTFTPLWSHPILIERLAAHFDSLP